MPSATPFAPSDVLLEHHEAIATVTINRPARRNAMTLAMWRELGRLFEGLGADPNVRAIILTGAGGAFCAGADISEFPVVRATAEDGRTYEAAGDLCQTQIATVAKPTIAAISGPCYGGGVGLALACDFRVCDQTGYFAIPAARLSNVYGIVETRALLNAVGLTAAKEVLFTGRRYGAEEAHRINLATHLTAGGALSAARELAAGMRHAAPLTIKGAKIVLAALAHGEVDGRHDAIQAVMDEAVTSADYKEGVAAFGEKRDPVFTGR